MDVEVVPPVEMHVISTSITALEKKKKRKSHENEKNGMFNSGGGTKDSVSINRMERKKKRKALDKERHRAALETEESSISKKITQVTQDTEPHHGMPEFHIGVFKDLASVELAVREGAAERLVTELQLVQEAHENTSKDPSSVLQLEARKDIGMNECAPSLRYAVGRLIRGASSSRECARPGFALGLSLLVEMIPIIKVDSLLKLVNNSLEVSSSMKGLDQRDCLLGRLFVYAALSRSGRLIKEWNNDCNTSLIKNFINILLTFSAKKQYLQEPAAAILLDMVEKLPMEAVLNHVLDAGELLRWFESASKAGYPDALLVALKIQEKLSLESSILGKILPQPFGPAALFSRSYLSSHANCFKESTICLPRVHSLWPVLVNILLPEVILQAEDLVSASHILKKSKRSRKSTSLEEENKKHFQCFCEVVMEGCLLPLSHDHKHLALKIMTLLLPRLPASLVPILFSYTFVQCLIDLLLKKGSSLQKVAHHFLEELSNWVGDDDVRRVAVTVALQKHSNGKFDCLSRGKLVKSLISEFKTESGCMLFIQNFTNLFLNQYDRPGEQSVQSPIDENSAGDTYFSKDLSKAWIVEFVPCIMKQLKLGPKARFRVQKAILKFLAVQGLFSASLGSELTSFELQEKFRWPKVTCSSAVCKVCVEQIQSFLTSAQKLECAQRFIHGHHNDDDAAAAAAADDDDDDDLGSYFMRFLATLHSIPSVTLFRSLSDEDEAAFNKLQEMEAKLYNEEKNYVTSAGAKQYHALRYLLIQLLLQVLIRPGEFTEPVSDLIICCNKLLPAGMTEVEGDDSENDSPPEPMDVLLDTLLSIITDSSAHMRYAVEQVFKHFCANVTQSGLQRMLRIIRRDLPPSRYPKSDVDEFDDGDGEEDDFLGMEEVANQDVDEEDGGTDDDGEQTDDDCEHVVEEAIEGSPEDSDNYGELDDDAMFRMDTYLAQIFKERKNPVSTQSQLVVFKLRILSLLDIYLHGNSSKSHVITVYRHLSQVFINLDSAEMNKEMGQKIWGILQKKIFRAKDCPKVESEQLPVLTSLLEKNLKLASRPFKRERRSAETPAQRKQSPAWKRHQMISTMAQESAFWILKVIDAGKFSGAEHLQQVFAVIKSFLVNYLDSKNCEIKSDFLKEIVRRRPWIGTHIFRFLLGKLAGARSEFRRVEALGIVLEILKFITSPPSSHTPSRGALKTHLQELGNFLKELVANMPGKQARRADMRKFCGKVFQFVSVGGLRKPFLKRLSSDARAVFSDKLGDLFSRVEKEEQKKIGEKNEIGVIS